MRAAPGESVRQTRRSASLAPESEEGGCPNWDHNEDGDDGDAHNGSIHVLMCFARGSSSCMCVCVCDGCTGAITDSALADVVNSQIKSSQIQSFNFDL